MREWDVCRFKGDVLRCHEDVLFWIGLPVPMAGSATRAHMSGRVGVGDSWGIRILVFPAGALVHRRPCDVEADRYAFA